MRTKEPGLFKEVVDCSEKGEPTFINIWFHINLVTTELYPFIPAYEVVVNTES